MSTTATFSGIDESGKSSSRVLRPPGGGDSGIFGGASYDASSDRPAGIKSKPKNDHFVYSSPESQKNQAPAGQPPQASRGDKRDESYNNIFGNSAPEQQKGGKALDCINPITGLRFGVIDSHINPDSYGVKPQQQDSFNVLTGAPFATQDNVNNNEGARNSSASNKQRGAYNPITGQNYAQPDQSANSTRVRQPPGGASSGIF